MDAQTVLQVGNSLAVTIPKMFSKTLGWQKGKKVYADIDPIEGKVIISSEKISSDGLTPEYFAWKKNFFKKNSELLTRLSKFHGR